MISTLLVSLNRVLGLGLGFRVPQLDLNMILATIQASIVASREMDK